MTYFLTNLIRYAHEREGFISALIFGNQGIGKTSYALHVAKEVYGGWDHVLDYLFFNPKDAINVMEQAIEEEKRIPLIIMDDAGIWLGKTEWWRREKVEFAEFFDIIRTVCSSVVFTTPADNLMSRLSREIMLRIKVTHLDGEVDAQLKEKGMKVDPKLFRLAKIYRFSLSPLFQPNIYKTAFDVFPALYPDEVKKKYDRLRLKAIKWKLERVKKEIEKEEKKRKR